MAGDPLVFDIETGAAPQEQLVDIIAKQMEDWEPPKNIKDEAKIEERRNKAIEAIVNKAALSPITGRILAIGYLNPFKNGGTCAIKGVSEGAHVPCDPCSETDLIAQFWNTFTSGRTLLGWNILGFDLPFIYRRSIVLGIDVPPMLRGDANARWAPLFHDIMHLWSFGLYGPDRYESLDTVCKACGIKGKMDGVDGSMFEQMYLRGDATTRAQAIEYCKMDLLACWGVAERCGWKP